MNITFATTKLEKQANDVKRCQKELGHTRARLFQIRLNALLSAHTLEDVRYLPGNYHELSGNRKGQWACNLDHPYRLIF